MSSSPPADPHATDQDALPPGTRFGELEIRRVLGIGGFGIVYLAVDHALEREVALKEYMPSSLASRGQGPQITVRSGAFAETYAVGLRSFVNEARLLAKFDHPSMVKVYRFWEENGTAYMVMPYLQGRTLRDARRAMQQPPDEAWIRAVLDPVLAAVELLHREGVYHRDIAPDNILLPPDAAPILLDFGAARRVISDRTQSLTAILKPSYAPIEQYAEMASLRQGPWTDIYAIGAVLHFLLFGAPPPPATARAVQDDLQGLAARRVPGASPRLMAVLAWTLAVRPAERPQTIDALRGALEGRITPPAAARDGATLPGAAMPVPASSGYEPTQRATGPYAQPTQAQGHGSDAETIVQRLKPRPQPPPAAAPAAAAPPSRGGMIAASLGVVALLVAGAGWWLFGSSRPGPTDAAGRPPGVLSTPAAVTAAPAAAPAALAPATPTPTAVAKPAVDVAARPAVELAPESAAPTATDAAAARPATDAAAAKPAVTARPTSPVDATAQRPRSTADSGALQPRSPSARAVEPQAEPPRSTDAAAAAAQAAARPAAVVAASPPAVAPPTPATRAAATGPATAREACGSRVLIALAYCIERECKKPEYAANPECVKIAEERRRRAQQ